VTGTLRPVREAQITSEIRGDLTFETVQGRVLTEGASVDKDQIIARIKNQEWVVGVRGSSKKLAMDTAQKTLQEQEVLFKRGLTTEKEVENARKAWQDARAGHEDAEIQIDKTVLRAPIAGVLSAVSDITQGTLVNQNSPIAKIVDFSKVVVDLQIPNAQISKVSIGQPLRLHNYALPDQFFEGEIHAINPVLDPATRTFRAVGLVGNPHLLLRPGMFVQAEIITESRKDVVLISRKLVQRRRSQKVVFVEEEGRAQQRDVETGLEDKLNVEILSGLGVGDHLITSNYETLRPRTRVRVTGAEK
ncbi:MAG: efflux RND transporter periplasmic adaptor subunit, partial [bacterium]|nr:efflux RND transporter periplasmic adaptor subunit [bacterium]